MRFIIGYAPFPKFTRSIQMGLVALPTPKPPVRSSLLLWTIQPLPRTALKQRTPDPTYFREPCPSQSLQPTYACPDRLEADSFQNCLFRICPLKWEMVGIRTVYSLDPSTSLNIIFPSLSEEHITKNDPTVLLHQAAIKRVVIRMG